MFKNIYLERWDHTAHCLDMTQWQMGYERSEQGDHKVWFGPFFLSIHRAEKKNRTHEPDERSPPTT